MSRPDSGLDPEVAAIAAVSAALLELPDSEARGRVLSYVMARFGMASVSSIEAASVPMLSAFEARSNTAEPTSPIQEIPGVAKLSPSGDLRITIRDLKAKSGLDAAVRLALVAIYAHERLLGEPMSSRRTLTPVLKEWRLYDGNTRARLSKEKGIIRDGDALHLDAHSRRDAERIIEEILDDGLSGSWKPR
jgi:hypothetical protein